MSDTPFVGKKPRIRVNGMYNALNIAADLGFSMAHSPSRETIQNDTDLVTILRELTEIQRKIANLEVELQGRKEDKNVAHLTHVNEMENKSRVLARFIEILEDVIRDKDRIIARLQQHHPCYLDCVPVEVQYQKQFTELLIKAATDYGLLMASVDDFQWIREFNDSPIVWREMLHQIPVALASCARFSQAVTAMRESFTKLQALRVGHSSKTMTSESSFDDLAVGSTTNQGNEHHCGIEVGSENGDKNYLDGTGQRRMS